ncbi:hypothetical protein EI94DRAFT_1708213 [Lactarius quietus]|nr:hypothetical protein EI94DRAFT_1708213 [Lactarius quietus]
MPRDSNPEEDSEAEQRHKEMVPVIFKDRNALFAQLKRVFEMTDHIVVYGCFDIPEDPLIPNREHVKATVYDIWKVTGYRFRIRVKDHTKLEDVSRLTLFGLTTYPVDMFLEFQNAYYMVMTMTYHESRV